MARQPRPGAPHGSAEWRARVGAGVRRAQARRRELARVAPADLRHFEQSGAVAAALAPHVAAAQEEAAAITEALTASGRRELTPQREALVGDLVRLGVVLRGELGRYLATQDPEAASRVSSLAGARRQHLQTLGLERVAEDAPNLHDYLRARAREAPQDAAQAAEAGAAEAEARPARDARTGAQDGRESAASAPNGGGPEPGGAERLDGPGGEP